MDKDITKPNLVDQFLLQTYTKTQALKRLRILKDFFNFKYFQAERSDLDTKNSINQFYTEYSKLNYDPETLADFNFLSVLPETFFALFTKENITKLLNEIEKEVTQDNDVTLYIPFEMPKDDIEDIGKWFKQNFGPNTLFELSLDPSLIGGCALSYKGHYRDFSIKNVLQQNGAQISSLLLNLGR